LCLLQGLGHDKGDAIADRAHLVVREQRASCPVAFRTADILRHRIHQRADAVGVGVLAGQDAQHALGGGRFRRIDRLDARMRVRRHHHHAVALPRQRNVVDKAAAPSDEPLVLDAADRLTDTEFVHGYVHHCAFHLTGPGSPQ
jgi:hypothetical protein